MNLPVIERLVADRIASLHAEADAVRLRRSAHRRRIGWWRRSNNAQPAGEHPLRHPPPPHTHQFAAWASEVGARIATDGVDRHTFAVAALTRLAERSRVNPSVVAAMSDGSLPRALRERAAGHVLRILAAGPPTSVDTERDTSTVDEPAA